MIARSRLVGNFLSHSRVQRQLTKVDWLSQSVRLQSTNDNSEKMTYQYRRVLKVNMKQRNEIFINGLSEKVSEDDLRAYFSRFGKIETCAAFMDWGYVTFNSSYAAEQVLNSAPHYIIGDRITNENAELLTEMKKLVRTKYQRYPELKVKRVSDKMILINDLPKEISQNAIRAYFSQFGRIEFCNVKDRARAFVNFKSPNAVNEALKSGPHYIVGDRITNENQELFAFVERELKVTIPRRVMEWFSKIFSSTDYVPFSVAIGATIIVYCFIFKYIL
ncbi:RNA recognition motif domain-containing protein [Ditylenchus destructor]|uniref:RNA recognition motif domain-containing protein n=1 Tax=Ditylenchus destructor TaxID=166010 RepID=A0AAD4QTY2_9BILA|nr:RNA recognition motif domain-containing protein [Ditylenchus destructor]